MRTTLERNEENLIRDRSEFIGILCHVTSESSVQQYLKEIRNEFPKAKHYCYAYNINGKKKCSDDGEPSKTAGRPLLELIERRELDEVLLVVVRYFGGILLGASRLMSTYLEAGVNVVDSADLFDISEKYVYETRISYSQYEELKRLIKMTDISLENVSFDEEVSLSIVGDETTGEQVINWFPHIPLETMGKRKVYLR